MQPVVFGRKANVFIYNMYLLEVSVCEWGTIAIFGPHESAYARIVVVLCLGITSSRSSRAILIKRMFSNDSATAISCACRDQSPLAS